MTAGEAALFKVTFENKIKPAVERWAKVYAGRLPFTPDQLTPENFVERIGNNPSYYEFVFVLNGVTLGIRDSQLDSGGIARVDYLNAPQSKSLAILPANASQPSLTTPVTKKEIAALAKNDLGENFMEHEIEMTPTGLSGSMNGGALVDVGGDGYNFLSSRLSLVFGADGKLVYYCKGLDIMAANSPKRIPNGGQP